MMPYSDNQPENSSLISARNQYVLENTEEGHGKGGYREGAGRKPGVRLPCGACGATLTASEWREHFRVCPDRPRVMRTRTLVKAGKWKVPPAERPTVRTDGEISEKRPATSYDLFAGRQKRCACGEIFVGPPNRRACDKCRARKG